MPRKRELAYLIVGVINTLVGYCLVVGLYYLLRQQLGVLPIAILANALAISFSFTTLKLFVFRTRGNWLREYLRSYVVYGSMAFLSVLILWALVEKLGVIIWIAQGVAILLTVVLSYIGHSQFTFRRPEE